MSVKASRRGLHNEAMLQEWVSKVAVPDPAHDTAKLVHSLSAIQQPSSPPFTEIAGLGKEPGSFSMEEYAVLAYAREQLGFLSCSL